MHHKAVRPTRARLLALTLLAGAALSACGGSDDDPAPAAKPFATLDGKAPLVIGHRGLPGLHPEETQASYEGAADVGADSLEEDLHLSKDCVLVARHNPWLSDNTNVATVAATVPEVAARKRTVPGRLVDVAYTVSPPTNANEPKQYLSDLTDPADQKSVLKSLIVDGEDHTNDWSITDFTAAELKQWIKGTTYDARADRPTAENGTQPVLTMQEVLAIAKAKSASTGRTLTVYPEVKNPYWNNQQAIANGCDTAKTGHPFEDAVLKFIVDNNLNDPAAPIFVQSFDPASLKYLKGIGLKARKVQLIDGNDTHLDTGVVTYSTSDVYTFVDGRPYSWTINGDGRYFDAMLTPAGLAEIKTYADGIGPWKPQVMAWKQVPYAGGTKMSDINSVTPTSLIADAHKAGLVVHSFTFRNEKQYLPGLYNGDPVAEYLPYFRAGIDGVFTDFAGTGVAARAAYLKELGR